MSVTAKKALRLKLLGREREAFDTDCFRFERGRLRWRAGQHLHARIERGEPQEIVEEGMGIASAPFEGEILLLARWIKPLNAFRRVLHDLVVGDTLLVEGVAGELTVEEPARPLVFVAGGLGVAPFRSILFQLDRDGTPLHLDMFYLNRDENFLFGDVLEDLIRRHPDARLHPFVGTSSIPEGALRAAVADAQAASYLVCGPPAMVEATRGVLRRFGAPDRNVRSEVLTGYDEL